MLLDWHSCMLLTVSRQMRPRLVGLLHVTGGRCSSFKHICRCGAQGRPVAALQRNGSQAQHLVLQTLFGRYLLLDLEDGGAEAQK